MPRKSLAKERREQILDAFERCITKSGLEATTLEQVAEEADVARSIIRHYIGNRDDLVEALVDRRLQQSTEAMIALYAGLSPKESVEITLDTMFTTTSKMDEKNRILSEVLTSSSDRYPAARQKLQYAFEALIRSFADDLHRLYPQTTHEKCDEVAYAIICISQMNESFMWLGVNPHYNAHAHKMAQTLIDTLK